MGTTLKSCLTIIGFILIVTGHHSYAQSLEAGQYSQSLTEKYSQKTLLKNWALSVCLAEVSKDVVERDDANATASAYLEFGRQPIEAYESLRKLAKQYASKKYGGSIKSEFNTMKCIDLLHSAELDKLTGKLLKEKPGI